MERSLLRRPEVALRWDLGHKKAGNAGNAREAQRGPSRAPRGGSGVRSEKHEAAQLRLPERQRSIWT